MRHFWQQIRTALRDHRWLGLLGCLYALFVIAQCLIAGVPLYEYVDSLGGMLWSIGMAVMFFAVMMMLFFARSYAWALWETPRRGRGLRGYFLSVAGLFDKKCEHYCDSRLFADGLIGFMVLQAMQFVGLQKSLLPYISPFRWDPLFSAWDKAMHFGRHPFELLVPLVDALGPWAARVLEYSYIIWFPAMFATCFYCMFMDPRFYRHLRFLWAYLLSWMILGSLCALLFFSVGPVYFHDFYPQQPDVYGRLLEHLSRVMSRSPGGYADIVGVLLKWARDDRILDFNAISAMPSMHVAIAWLQVLYWGSVSRWMMALAGVFFLAILLGSVYLAFHYAIDGYLSIIGVSLIWWASGRIVHRLHPGAKDLLRVLPHKRG